MKTRIFIFLYILANSFTLFSQIPKGFNYQAVARNSSGSPIINTSLPVRITIQADSLGGTIFWQELHSSVTTNGSGVINLVIGKGVKQTGDAASFGDINWNVTPKFIKTEINFNGWKNLGSSRFWSVPYAMIAGDLGGPVKKLAVAGETAVNDEALFEVKNKDGNTVFAVYNEGVRVYVADGAKGAKGGFAVGSFGTGKAASQDYFSVSKDSVRINLDTNPATKKAKGGFAVGGYDMSKGLIQNYFLVEPDSIRAYIDTNPAKTRKGGFAVGGFDMAKDASDEFFRVTSDSVKVSKSLLIPRLTIDERDHLPFTPGEALIIFNTTEGCMQIFKNNVWSNIWCFNCAPSVIIQPVDQAICSGGNALFFVSATGTNLSYHWQESRDNGTTWNDLTNGGSNPSCSGATGNTLTLTNIPFTYHTFKYRCRVFAPCPPDVISNAVTLKIGTASPIITTQPADQQLSGSCSASFKVVSPGYGVSYKWQQSADGGTTWNNISDGGTNPVFAGTATSDLNITNALFTINNYKFRCIVSNLCGSDVISLPATLTIPPSTIRDQPVNDTIFTGQLAWFHTVANLSGVRYQWQESRDGGSTWSNVVAGGTSPLYQYPNNIELFLISVPLSYNNYKYRCVMSHDCRPDFISNAVTLFVLPTPQVTDIDGNTYNTLGVGSEIWMAENLKTTRYSDGTPIPLVNTKATWDALNESSLAYCWYSDNISNKNTYGALYTWHAATRGSNSNTDPSGVQGICPTGWHLPSPQEWLNLTSWLGLTPGGAMKETGTTHWQSPNTGATNLVGFKALPGGYRNFDGNFASMGYEGRWWTTNTDYNIGTNAYYFALFYNSDYFTYYPGINKENGHSVRCKKDQ